MNESFRFSLGLPVGFLPFVNVLGSAKNVVCPRSQNSLFKLFFTSLYSLVPGLFGRRHNSIMNVNDINLVLPDQQKESETNCLKEVMCR